MPKGNCYKSDPNVQSVPSPSASKAQLKSKKSRTNSPASHICATPSELFSCHINDWDCGNLFKSNPYSESKREPQNLEDGIGGKASSSRTTTNIILNRDNPSKPQIRLEIQKETGSERKGNVTKKEITTVNSCFHTNISGCNDEQAKDTDSDTSSNKNNKSMVLKSKSKTMTDTNTVRPRTVIPNKEDNNNNCRSTNLTCRSDSDAALASKMLPKSNAPSSNNGDSKYNSAKNANAGFKCGEVGVRNETRVTSRIRDRLAELDKMFNAEIKKFDDERRQKLNNVNRNSNGPFFSPIRGFEGFPGHCNFGHCGFRPPSSSRLRQGCNQEPAQTDSSSEGKVRRKFTNEDNFRRQMLREGMPD